MPGLEFSFVIPTLQRSPLLAPLLERLSASPHVAQVVVVDNTGGGFSSELQKVEVLSPGRNIFVNPAWNLGVRESDSPLVALCNDDVLFDVDHVLRSVRLRLEKGAGVIGPSPACFDSTPQRRALAFRPTYELSYGFGTLMMFDRESWVPLPEHIRIWFGDAYLFQSQQRRNYIFHGTHIETPMSVTSSSPEFLQVIHADEEAYRDLAPQTYARRFGVEARAISAARHLRHRLRQISAGSG